MDNKRTQTVLLKEESSIHIFETNVFFGYEMNKVRYFESKTGGWLKEYVDKFINSEQSRLVGLVTKTDAEKNENIEE